jgi:hypothetical protein
MTIQSNNLLAEINNCIPLEGLSTSEKSRPLDGFTLLRYHFTLKRHLLQIVGESAQDVSHELQLLVDGLLGDGQVFQSFGYETLYERGYLDYELWSTFQQQRIDSDIDGLDEAFRDDGDFNEVLPTANSRMFKKTELQPESSRFAPNAENDIPYAVHGSKLVQECTPSFDVHCIIPVDNENTGVTENKIHHTIGHGYGIKEAERSGDAQTVQSLADRSAVIEISKAPDTAVRKDHLKIVQTPLNADADASQPYGLWEAISSGNSDIVRILLDIGANANQPGVLWNAAESGNPDIVRMLLDAGADANQPYVLWEAAHSGNPKIVRHLLGDLYCE